MITDIPLIEDETVIMDSCFKYSIIMFFLKSQLVLTNKRLLGKINNTFWIIPVGTSNVVYSLDNIVGVKLGKRLQSKFLVFSICILLVGLSLLHFSIHIGIILVLMGKIGIINSNQKGIILEDNNGGNLFCSISRRESTKAKELITGIMSRITGKTGEYAGK